MHSATMGTASVLPPPRRHQQQHSASLSAMSTSQYEPGTGPAQPINNIMAASSSTNGRQNGAAGFGPPVGMMPAISPFYGPNFPQPNPASQIVQEQLDNSAPQTTNSFDPRNLEIKTRSVEQTLLPLVQQISTLVNFKESIITGGKPKSERALRAALKIGTAVEAAVERFVAVGETIADENPDIQPELYDACQEARVAGSSIANLHHSMLADHLPTPLLPDGLPPAENGIGAAVNVDTAQLVRAARQLLSSVTRVLLLADRVLVKHILRAEDKIAYSLTKLEHTSNFSEFVQIFTEFGGQMVDLAHRSGDRQQDLKSEKRQAQMQVARAQLERLTMLLLTASKTLLRHPDDPAARQCRDGVFHQIRSALQLISVCVTDGVMHFEAASAYPSPMDGICRVRDGPLDIGIQLTASVAIRQLTEMLDMCRMMSMIGAGVRERLVSALGALCEMSADFTESAWTPHQQREQILDLLEECRFEMGNLVNAPPSELDERLRSESVEVTVERLNRRLKDFRKQLQVVALEQIAQVFRQNDDQTILSSLKTCSISGDIDGVERFLEQFRHHAEHLQEVCRLLHHISLTDALHVFTGHAERNLRALAPLTLLAGRVLCVHPSSRIARENLEVFCDTWATNVNDLARLTKELDAACSGRLAAEKQAYMSLPRPGVSPSAASSVYYGQQTATMTTPPSTPTSSISGVCRVVGDQQFCGGVFCGVGSVLPSYAQSMQYPHPLPHHPFIVHPRANNFVPVLCPPHQPPYMMAQSTTTLGSPIHARPYQMPRLARAASTPATGASTQIGTSDGQTRAKTPGGDRKRGNEPKKQQIMVEEKKRGKGKEKRKTRKEAKAEEENEEEGKEKEGSRMMSLSAIFRRIRREPSGGRKKKGGGRKEKTGMVENCHSDGETLEKEGGRGRRDEEGTANLHAFSQSSRSLRVELGNGGGGISEEEGSKAQGQGHSPIYSQIQKPSAATPQRQKPEQSGYGCKMEECENNMNRRPMSPAKSAFTPYGQFQQQQQQQVFVHNSPSRRMVEDIDEEGGRMMKFNRIGGGREEPVIVCQKREQEEEEAGNSVQESTNNSSGYGTGQNEHRRHHLERKRSSSSSGGGGGATTTTSSSGNNSRKSSNQQEGKEGEEERIVAFEAKGKYEVPEEEEEEYAMVVPQYATVMMMGGGGGGGRAPLAKCEEADEEEEEEGEKVGMMEVKRPCTVEDGGRKEEFVVRMRAKKSARMAAHGGRQTPGGGNKFEQRISQILESLQAEAESLIRLQHGEENGGGNGMDGYWMTRGGGGGGR